MSAFENRAGRVFEVGLHNREVRALVKENRSHALFDDRWADVQVHEVCADDADSARSKVFEDYPAEAGFVVDHIAPSAE